MSWHSKNYVDVFFGSKSFRWQDFFPSMFAFFLAEMNIKVEGAYPDCVFSAINYSKLSAHSAVTSVSARLTACDGSCDWGGRLQGGYSGIRSRRTVGGGEVFISCVEDDLGIVVRLCES